MMDKQINKRFIEGIGICIYTHPKICKNQKAFCKIMDMHEPKIAQIKIFFAAPTVDQIAKMGKIFGISPTWVILGIEPKIIELQK